METQIALALLGLFQKRNGGQYALRGFIYQTNYIVWKLLKEFSEDQNDNLVFRPEGIEDLDSYCRISEVVTNVFTQVKCLNDGLDADKFTKDILPNLLGVYECAPESKFKIISNQHVSGKWLGKLKDEIRDKGALQPRTFEHWSAKIRTIKPNFTDDEIEDFLSRIEFERKEESDLISDSLKLLIEFFGVIQGNEQQFHTALFRAVLEWSMQRQEVRKMNILEIIQFTQDERFENQALRNGWISEVLFEETKDVIIESAYFEGKPARPYHISANLPVERPDWERQIVSSIQEFDVTVIKSSSGQGKSTLAWQAASAMKAQRFRVYELFECPASGLQDLFLFLKSRLKIGIVPLVVIDGLNKRVEEWSELASRVQELRGVKFLVTTREEDWFRYGNMTSRLFLRPISIELNIKEAEAIFRAFKSRGMVHPSLKTWQVAWDEVKSEKLLLEFVYLITQGKMIRERLSDQLDLMRSEPENHVKKAILRLVALADVLNLRLPTDQLVHYIKSEIGFGGDRNDLFQSLKNEYHIHVEGTAFIEGLHPVRSKHLVDLLHSSIPLVETLVELAPLLEPDSLTDFASRSPRLLLSQNEKERFFQLLAEKVVEMPYSQILNITVGVFGSDAYLHWLENKESYDKISTKGLLFYASSRTPFANIESSILGVFNKFDLGFAANLAAIKQYDISNSNTSFFLKSIHPKLRLNALRPDLDGVFDLERWLERFDISMNLLNKINVETLKNAIKELNVESLSQALRSVFLLNESLYYRFYSECKNELFSKLLQETNTLEIEPSSVETLVISYIVDEEQKINDQSVERLRLISYSLPFYKNYEIKGVYFSNPFLKTLRTSHDESVKNSTWEGWLKNDPFATKANGHWVAVIESEYEFSTHFEWQEYWYEFRKKFLAWIRQASRVLEAAMDNKMDYRKEEIGWREKTKQILEAQGIQKSIRYDYFFTKARFEIIVKNITDWDSKAGTVVFQFSKIADENTRRLLPLNARELFENLFKMQAAFDEISLQTGSYFDTSQLVQQEINAHRYFAEITSFYHEKFAVNPRKIFGARQEVKNWINENKIKELKKLEAVKKGFDAALPYELILPNHIIEDTYYDSVVLGIKEISVSEFDQFGILILENLLGLLELEIGFCYLVLIENNAVFNNRSLRFKRESLQAFKECINGANIELPQPFFLPMPVTSDILNCLSGIQMSPESEEHKRKSEILLLHRALWEYSKIRISLSNLSSDVRKSQRLEKIADQISSRLNSLRSQPDVFQKYQSLVVGVLSGSLSFDEELCERLFFEDVV